MMGEAPKSRDWTKANVEDLGSLFPMTWGVALCALLSVVLLLTTGLWGVIHDVSRATRDPWDPVRAFAPHVVVLAAAVSGFRMTANVAAMFAAVFWGRFSGFLTLVSLGAATGPLFLTIIQLALFGFAIADIRLQRNGVGYRVSLTRRLSGPALSALIAIVVMAAVHRAHAAREREIAEDRAKQLRSSIAPIDHARLVPPKWNATSALYQLHSLTQCIDWYHRAPIGHQPFPRSFTDLVRWAASNTHPILGQDCYSLIRDADTTRTPALLDRHHVVRYKPPLHLSDTTHARGYVLELEAVWDSTDGPMARDSTAVKNYLLDAAGRVHVTSARRRARSSDHILPVCPASLRVMREFCWINTEYY